jgi:hypothetical protein
VVVRADLRLLARQLRDVRRRARHLYRFANQRVAQQLDANTTVRIHGQRSAERPPVALTRSLGLAANNRPVAQISRSLALTPALLAQIGHPFPVRGTQFVVVDRGGRVLVGAGRGKHLPGVGDATLSGSRYRTFRPQLGQAPYRLQLLVPERHLQQVISSARTKLIVIVGLTVLMALALAFLLGAPMLASLGDLFRRAEHTDTAELASLPNRRAFRTALAAEVHRSQRYGSPLTLTLFDLDHFKQVNDQFGHPAGDRVLARPPVRSSTTCVRATCSHV